MTAAWALNCHYNIAHVLPLPQTITTGGLVWPNVTWADLEILAQSEARCRPIHMAVKVQPSPPQRRFKCLLTC